MTDESATSPAPEPRDGGDVALLESDRPAGGAARALRPDRARGRIRRDRAHPAQARARRRGAPASAGSAPASPPTAEAPPASGEPSTAGRDPGPVGRPSVKAPLTGIFYASPAPGTAPYVQVGGEVAVGQVIGLIEAMKLFNEIKSDLAGRVVRVVPESGALVKAKQPLIEVEPL